ncbi:MAG: HAMP domain-containing histidine kinase [Propionibacteriaceae bacterium]|jgi:two-component system sensor histidine kinase SenX3|nr:HAMP domain-containing histidine kinase [Propionibacteriaceae bacterium]
MVKRLPQDTVAVLHAFGGHALVVTPKGKLVYLSKMAQTLPLASDGKLTHPELLTQAKEAWASGGEVTRPYDLQTLGPLHNIVVHAAVLDGRWILLAITDRTGEVLATEIRRDFVSNIGHELRTPTTSLALIAQALRSAADSPEAVSYFAARLEGVAERLEQLTNDMMALAFVQEGERTLRRDLVMMEDVVTRAVANLREKAQAKGVSLRCKVGASAVVRGDKQALISAVENLVSNAVHYSKNDSKVTVATRVDLADNAVTVSVIDQGIGIEPADQERVFERFYRADAARSHRTGGTGLGLAIVRNTVVAHGGDVSVVSRPGKGSTFALVLPLAAKTEAADG